MTKCRTPLSLNNNEAIVSAGMRLVMFDDAPVALSVGDQPAICRLTRSRAFASCRGWEVVR
jgi:hypothetical protein